METKPERVAELGEIVAESAGATQFPFVVRSDRNPDVCCCTLEVLHRAGRIYNIFSITGVCVSAGQVCALRFW